MIVDLVHSCLAVTVRDVVLVVILKISIPKLWISLVEGDEG